MSPKGKLISAQLYSIGAPIHERLFVTRFDNSRGNRKEFWFRSAIAVLLSRDEVTWKSSTARFQQGYVSQGAMKKQSNLEKKLTFFAQQEKGREEMQRDHIGRSENSVQCWYHRKSDSLTANCYENTMTLVNKIQTFANGLVATEKSDLKRNDMGSTANRAFFDSEVAALAIGDGSRISLLAASTNDRTETARKVFLLVRAQAVQVMNMNDETKLVKLNRVLCVLRIKDILD